MEARSLWRSAAVLMILVGGYAIAAIWWDDL